MMIQRALENISSTLKFNLFIEFMIFPHTYRILFLNPMLLETWLRYHLATLLIPLNFRLIPDFN